MYLTQQNLIFFTSNYIFVILPFQYIWICILYYGYAVNLFNHYFINEHIHGC